MKLFVEVSPAFYKTMLFNALNKKERILVTYQDDPNRPFRDGDFLKGEKEFDYMYMTGNPMRICQELATIIRNTPYDELIAGGYDRIYSWLSVMLSPKKKNSIIVESTYRETKKKGIRAFLKRLFFKRVSRAYVCGKSHADLVRAFGFKGLIIDIGSVGFIRRVPQPPYEAREVVKKFLYVGRLTAVKNLEWLIKQFAKHPRLELTIIGGGELGAYLKSIATENVRFTGPIPNSELSKWYQESDVFVLPSYSESYGLVVEEALNNGTPVLLSHMIGCQDNLVVANKVGFVFQLDDETDFESKLAMIQDVGLYNQLRENVSKMDFVRFEENMVNSFL